MVPENEELQTPATPEPPAPHEVKQTLSEREPLPAYRRREHRAPRTSLLLMLWHRLRVAAETIQSGLWQWIRSHREQLGMWATSFFLHALAALALSVWMLAPKNAAEWVTLLVSQRPSSDIQPDPVAIVELVQPESLRDQNVDSTLKQMLSDMPNGLATLNRDSPLEDVLTVPTEVLDPGLEIPVHLGDLGGRSAAGKQVALRRYGGTADSEKAVNQGLKWLASIQQKDGSWNFAQVGGADGAGTLQTTDMGATALSLLCFLGAGHTHETEGPYQPVVTEGLAYIFQHADRGSYGADLRGRYQANSGMYVQGIATICICEAAALQPRDRELRKLAIEAVTFIERAQDPIGGGWRYQPREPGDTSVVGWQVMALQSARAGKIRVDDDTIRDARRFLQLVARDEGAQYSYLPDRGDERPSMTAVGLLCRMYLGWKHDHPALRRGVERLSALGPSREDIYYNYYAAQVMHHYGGEAWERWNAELRPWLVQTQVQEGPATGSWDVTDPHGQSGGRIYQTALSILTLEVYYRHLPLYRKLQHMAEREGSSPAEQ